MNSPYDLNDTTLLKKIDSKQHKVVFLVLSESNSKVQLI
jgi:hypothetical protein